LILKNPAQFFVWIFFGYTSDIQQKQDLMKEFV